MRYSEPHRKSGQEKNHRDTEAQRKGSVGSNCHLSLCLVCLTNPPPCSLCASVSLWFFRLPQFLWDNSSLPSPNVVNFHSHQNACAFVSSPFRRSSHDPPFLHRTRFVPRRLVRLDRKSVV